MGKSKDISPNQIHDWESETAKCNGSTEKAVPKWYV